MHTSIQLLVPLIDRPALATDPRFNGQARPSRDDNATLVEIVDAEIAKYDYADITTRIESGGVRWEPVNTPTAIATDPQDLVTGRLIQVDDGQWHVSNPWALTDETGPVAQFTKPPPATGGDTVEILKTSALA